MTADKRAIACNYSEATKIASKGALAYLVLANPGGGHDRIEILVRSRGGRWVRKWENLKRLENFRAATLPPEHPRYEDERVWTYGDIAALVARLQQAKATL